MTKLFFSFFTDLAKMQNKEDDIGWRFAEMVKHPNMIHLRSLKCLNDYKGSISCNKQHIADIPGDCRPCRKAIE